MKWAIPKRYLKLTLYKGRNDKKEVKVLSDLDISFNISFDTSATVSGAVNEGNIKIGGLTRDTMVYLATSTTPWTKNIIQNQITIDAGYEGNHAVIFDGNIIEATPNLDSPNYTISIKAKAYYQVLVNENISLSFKGQVPASKIAQEIAKRLSFVFFNGLTEDVMVTDYQLKDASPLQHARNLAQITGLDVFVDRNRLFIKHKGTPILESNDKNILKISDDKMIGAPIPNAMGCDLSVRLDPSIMTGQEVELQSKKFPTLNSTNYIIQTISHHGETRGNNWRTKLVMLRKDLYEQ